MKKYLIILIIAVLAIFNLTGYKAKTNYFTTNVKGKLPNPRFGNEIEGFAGAFSGIYGNKLFIAGGTNYSERKPWEGGSKIFYDEIYTFDILKDSLIYSDNYNTLPFPVAYGASVSIPDGILCIGGNDSEECFPNVFLMQWDKKFNHFRINDFPNLPVPLSYTSATVLDDIVYVVGGSSSVDGMDTGNYFFSLDLSRRNSTDFSWEKLPSFPGKGRIFSVVAGQMNGKQPCVYLFSGRNVDADRKISVYRDGLVFNRTLNKWENLTEDASLDFPVMGGTAFTHKKNEIVILGGSSGEQILKEQIQRKQFHEIIKSRDTIAISEYKEERIKYYSEHPGFLKDILIFNTVNNTIIKGGTFDSFCPIMTTAVPYKNGAFMASGETKPGLRTANIFLIKPESDHFRFLLIESKIALISLLCLGAIGIWLLLRQKKRQIIS